MNDERTDIDPEHDAAIRDFLAAGRRYRDYLVRHHPDRPHGAVVYAEGEGGELVLYSEASRYSQKIRFTVTRFGDPLENLP